MKIKKKLVRITTVPISLEKLLENQLKYMNEYYDVIAVSSNESLLKEVGMDQGVSVFPVNLTRKISPFSDLIALFKLVLFLKKERPFIVHSHTPKAGIIGMLAARIANVPHRLHTVAGLPLLVTSGFKRRLLHMVETVTYKCASRVFPNSHGLKRIILDIGLIKDEKKLRVIGHGSSNGIDSAAFDPKIIDKCVSIELKRKLGILETDFVFIFVGRLVGDKGVNELILAFKHLSSRYLTLKLLLVGASEDDLDPLSKDTKLEISRNPKILSIGYQNDVRPYFTISNALVFPSHREGFPNVVMQAGAMCLPSIVSDINGCNEIIMDGVNGTIIPVQNLGKLKQAMERLFLDAGYYNLLRSSARSCILSKYERSVVWKDLLNEYESLNDV